VTRGHLVNAPYYVVIDEQVISLFEAVLAVLSEHLDILLWTFDSDFDVMRVFVWREGLR
jgi:hypothetical protein